MRPAYHLIKRDVDKDSLVYPSPKIYTALPVQPIILGNSFRFYYQTRICVDLFPHTFLSLIKVALKFRGEELDKFSLDLLVSSFQFSMQLRIAISGRDWSSCDRVKSVITWCLSRYWAQERLSHFYLYLNRYFRPQDKCPE